jgi:hypothetical protein
MTVIEPWDRKVRRQLFKACCVAMTMLVPATLLAAPAHARPVTRDEGLRKMYGQLVIKGFFGRSPRDASVRQVRKALEQSLIGGVIFFHKNIRNPKQVEALTQLFPAGQHAIHADHRR